MRFYRITTCDHIDDLSGEGAYLYGGRWNSKGTRILYTAESMALAMMEALAHITMLNQKRAYCRAVLEIDFDVNFNVERGTRTMDETWFKEVFEKDLPSDFRGNPGHDVLRASGDTFIEEGKYLALKVPSVVVPDSFNYLLNPLHPIFENIKVVESIPVVFDQRIIKLKTGKS